MVTATTNPITHLYNNSVRARGEQAEMNAFSTEKSSRSSTMDRGGPVLGIPSDYPAPQGKMRPHP